MEKERMFTAGKASSSDGVTGLSRKTEETVRTWYSAWEQEDWGPLDLLLLVDGLERS